MRNDWTKIQSESIDWLRPVMAFMVICLHIQLFYVGKQWSVHDGLFDVFVICLCKIICPVAVPTFFFISGYLFFKGLEDWETGVWKHKMIKRIRTLLVPFVLWNLIALIAFPITRYAGSVLKGVPMDNLMDLVRDRGLLRLFWDKTLFDGSHGQPMDTPMWFVRDLMVVVIFTPAIHWLLKKAGVVFVAILAALFLANIWIPVPGFGIKATFFFTWGAFYSIKRLNFVECFRKIRIPSVILFSAGLILMPFLWENDMVYFNPVLRLFITVELVFCFNTVSTLMAESKIRINDRLIKSSFFIYCSHMVIIASAVMWLVMLPHFNSGVICSIQFIAGAVLTFFICHYIFVFLDYICPSVSALLTGGRH